MTAKQTAVLNRVVPALVFGALAFFSFKSLADRPHEGGGGPPIIDLSPLIQLGLGLASLIVSIFLLARTAKPAPPPTPAPPQLPAAKARRS